jgi:Phage integrase family
MSGQRLDIGEHGDIQYRTKPSGRVAATVYFRDPQGIRKRLEATGGSKTAVRRLLIKKLEEAVSAGAGRYTRQSTFAEVAADWLDSLDELVIAGRRSAGAVFPASLGGHRDPSNVERDHRVVRTGTSFAWVVPHTYRKTVATMLDQQGLSARAIADQLRHARISMTQDVYMGRRVVDQAAALALEGAGRGDSAQLADRTPGSVAGDEWSDAESAVVKMSVRDSTVTANAAEAGTSAT